MLLTALLAGLPLGACSDSPPPPPRAAAWISAASGNGESGDGGAGERRPRVLVIRVLAVAPLIGIGLTAPDGRSFAPVHFTGPAADGDDADGRRRWPDVSVAGSGGSRSGLDAGISIGLPVRNPFATDPPRYRAAQAEFRLPEATLAAYQARPQDWRLDLQFADRDGGLPAPPVESGSGGR